MCSRRLCVVIAKITYCGKAPHKELDVAYMCSNMSWQNKNKVWNCLFSCGLKFTPWKNKYVRCVVMSSLLRISFVSCDTVYNNNCSANCGPVSQFWFRMVAPHTSFTSSKNKQLRTMQASTKRDGKLPEIRIFAAFLKKMYLFQKLSVLFQPLAVGIFKFQSVRVNYRPLKSRSDQTWVRWNVNRSIMWDYRLRTWADRLSRRVCNDGSRI